MKKTQKSHDPSFRMSLSLEELSAYIEDRLSPRERASVEEFLRDNPLYQETLFVLRDSYAEDPASLKEFAKAEEHFDRVLEKEVCDIEGGEAHSMDPIAELDPVPTSSTWTGSSELQPIPSRTSTHRSFSWMKLAASLVLLLGVALVLSQSGLFQSEAVQFAQSSMVHYEPNAQMSHTSDEALGLYHAKQYEEALPVLAAALAEGTTPQMQEKLQMFIGVSHTQLEQYEKSIPFFQQVIEGNIGSLKLDAQWYLALVYTQLKEQDKAKGLLESISIHQAQSRAEEELVNQAKELLELIS